jgi:uncharacterized protein YecT (DUF1311 family)
MKTYRAACAAIGLLIASAGLAAQQYPNTSTFGVPFSKDEPWYQQCMRVADLGETPPKTAGGCHAGELYYARRSQAVTSQGEWEQVRACAVAGSDNAVLMMLYANGFGVQRNTDIALHYACQLDFIAKAEMEARVEHLTSGRTGKAPFDQCDDITSGYMGGICASIREDLNKQVRDARLERVTKKLTPAGQEAFTKLRAAAERYLDAAHDEVDGRGTAANAMASQHIGKLREQFMQAVLDAAGGKLPAASAAAYAERDARLNEAYKAVMGISSTQEGWPDRIGDSTISHAAVRDTERRWLAYRDAFTAFAARLPSPPGAAAVKLLLTNQRIAQLNSLARN